MLSLKTKEILIHPRYHLWTSIDEQICDNVDYEEGILGIIPEEEKEDLTDSVVLFLNIKYAPDKEFESYYVVSYTKTDEDFFRELKKTRDDISVEEYATLFEGVLSKKDRKYVAEKTYEVLDKTLELFNMK